MSSKLIKSLLKRTKPEKDLLNNSLENTDRDKDVNELKSLYQIPLKEKGDSMPHYQVFSDGIQQADLLFMPKDYQYYYCLVVTDIHSRKCDAQAITGKSSDVIIKAFETIYKRKIIKLPIKIFFDSGSEFKGATKKYFEDHDIAVRYADTNRHRQVAMVEAKNKMIGSVLHKLMALTEIKSKKESRSWTKYLPDVVSAINSELPPPINTQLSDEPFSSKTNEDIITIGSKVRTKLDYPINIVNEKRLHGTFRSSDIRWSREVKEISNIILKPGFPIMYTVGDEDFNRTRNEIQVVKPITYI